jgi:hypothetical protein
MVEGVVGRPFALERYRVGAATSELSREFERADKIDPDSPTSDTPRGDDAGQEVPPWMPKAG